MDLRIVSTVVQACTVTVNVQRKLFVSLFLGLLLSYYHYHIIVVLLSYLLDGVYRQFDGSSGTGGHAGPLRGMGPPGARAFGSPCEALGGPLAPGGVPSGRGGEALKESQS